MAGVAEAFEDGEGIGLSAGGFEAWIGGGGHPPGDDNTAAASGLALIIATARAFQEGQTGGTFAGLAMGLNAIVTAVLVPVLVPLLVR